MLEAYLFPSRLIKCGYCKLKCKSNSTSKHGDVMDADDALYGIDVGALGKDTELPIPVAVPLILPGKLNWGTGISCDRSVRFELCILTANDNDVRSDGNGVKIVKRVTVNEHNLKWINICCCCWLEVIKLLSFVILLLFLKQFYIYSLVIRFIFIIDFV